MIDEQTSLLLAWSVVLIVGALLGAIFYGGLWWTVRKCLSSRHVGIWFLGSLLVRTSIVLIGFYIVASAHWERIIVCLSGFLIARFFVMRLTQPTSKPENISKGAYHATQPR